MTPKSMVDKLCPGRGFMDSDEAHQRSTKRVTTHGNVMVDCVWLRENPFYVQNVSTLLEKSRNVTTYRNSLLEDDPQLILSNLAEIRKITTEHFSITI